MHYINKDHLSLVLFNESLLQVMKDIKFMEGKFEKATGRNEKATGRNEKATGRNEKATGRNETESVQN